MASVGKDVLSSGGIPDLCSVVKASRDDALAIRRPGYLMYPIGMASVGKDIFAVDGIPDLYCFVTAPGSDAFAIRRPAYRKHSILRTCMAVINKNILSA